MKPKRIVPVVLCLLALICVLASCTSDTGTEPQTGSKPFADGTVESVKVGSENRLTIKVSGKAIQTVDGVLLEEEDVVYLGVEGYPHLVLLEVKDCFISSFEMPQNRKVFSSVFTISTSQSVSFDTIIPLYSLLVKYILHFLTQNKKNRFRD